MILNSIIRSSWVWFIAVLLILISITAGVMQKPSTQALALEERNSNWQAATFRYQRVTAAQLTQLNAAALWGIENSAVVEDLSTPWLLKGVIEEQEVRIAIIDVDAESEANQREKYLRFQVGDLLPDGAKLVKIGRNYVEYEKNGNLATKNLYE